MCLSTAVLAREEDINKERQARLLRAFVYLFYFWHLQVLSIQFNGPGAKKEENNIPEEVKMLCNIQTRC